MNQYNYGSRSVPTPIISKSWKKDWERRQTLIKQRIAKAKAARKQKAKNRKLAVSKKQDEEYLKFSRKQNKRHKEEISKNEASQKCCKCIFEAEKKIKPLCFQPANSMLVYIKVS